MISDSRHSSIETHFSCWGLFSAFKLLHLKLSVPQLKKKILKCFASVSYPLLNWAWFGGLVHQGGWSHWGIVEFLSSSSFPLGGLGSLCLKAGQWILRNPSSPKHLWSKKALIKTLEHFLKYIVIKDKSPWSIFCTEEPILFITALLNLTRTISV